MPRQRKGGIIYIQVNGQIYDAKGAFTYNLGVNKKEAIVGAEKIHGYKETPQVPFIEGAITDDIDLDLRSLQETDDATVTLELAVGKTVMLSTAWYADEGTGNTEEGEIPFRFEASVAKRFNFTRGIIYITQRGGGFRPFFTFTIKRKKALCLNRKAQKKKKKSFFLTLSS